MNLTKNLQNFSHKNELIRKGDKIILGVSGGPDSMCLLDVLVKLKEKYSLEIIIAHVNYNLRGVDSQKDKELVKKKADELNLKFELLEKKGLGEKNLEENCRKIRYDFFEKLRKENKFDLIAVAHNSCDQVETFFLNLFRGSGEKGLSGMKAKNGGIIRPLLFASKEDILDYNKKNGVIYRIDKTNKENIFLRNKIRNKLIPYLEKNFDTNIKKSILKTTQTFSEKESLAIRELITLFSGTKTKPSFSDIEEVRKILKSQKNKAQKFIFKNLKIEKRGDRLTIEKLRSN